MKKIMYTMLVALMTAFTFTSCEDVPAPYGDPNNNGGTVTPGTDEVAEGDGSLASPYNALGVTNYIKTLEAGVNSDNYVYIKGKVSSTKEISANYGNASFYISADGTTSGTQFYVYRVKGLGNKNIASDDEVKVGDDVIVYAKVVNYSGNTPETVQGEGYIYSLNGKTDGSTTPSTGVATGDGTKENPFNSIAANEYTSKLAKDAKSDKQIYIKGKVVSVKDQYNTTYGNASFYISDDGKADNQFYVFRALYLNNEKYTSGATLNVGDEVVVCGYVTNYFGNTPETVQNEAYLVELKSNGGGTPDTPDTPGDVTGDFEYLASSCGLDNQTALTTLTLTEGLTLTFDNGGGTNGPKYFTTGTTFRMYPKNTATFASSKKIESVTLVCDNYNGTIYNASGDITSTSGTVSTSDDNITIKGIGATDFTLTNASTTTGAASQLRFKKIVITYSK